MRSKFKVIDNHKNEFVSKVLKVSKYKITTEKMFTFHIKPFNLKLT